MPRYRIISSNWHYILPVQYRQGPHGMEQIPSERVRVPKGTILTLGTPELTQGCFEANKDMLELVPEEE